MAHKSLSAVSDHPLMCPNQHVQYLNNHSFTFVAYYEQLSRHNA